MSLNEDLLPDPVLEVPIDVNETLPQEEVKKLPDSAFFDTIALSGEVPQFAPVFVEQQGKAENLVDLATTQNQIQAQGAISVENALVVDSLSPGFINDNNPAALYSKTPSKTQYNESLLSIAASVDSQYALLKSSIEETTAQFYSAASESRTRILGAMVTGLTNVNRSIAKALACYDREDPCQIPYIFNNKKRLGDLLRESFDALTGDGVVQDSVQHDGVQHDCPYDDTAAKPYLDKLRAITAGNRDLIDTIELLLYSKVDNLIRLNGTQYLIEDGYLKPNPPEADFKFERSTMARIVELLGSDKLRARFKQLDEVFINQQAYFQSVPGLISGIEKNEQLTAFNKLTAITEISGNCIAGQMRIQAIVNIVGGMAGILHVMAELFDGLSEQN